MVPLEDSQVKALQFGYNDMYLDNKLVATEHLCCMVHVRAKFKYTLEQSGNKDAAYILEQIGELYKLEREYEAGKLSAGRIKLCRNSLKKRRANKTSK